MVNVRGTRRLRLAVELICEKLQITNKDIDAYAAKKRREAAHVKVAKKEVKPADKKKAEKK